MKFVVVGNSAAGVNALEVLRKLNPDAGIDLVAAEDAPVYSRCLLPYYLTGQVGRPGLLYRPESFYQKYAVTAHIGVRATLLDPAAARVELSDGRQLSYDRLLLATGARSKVPDVPGKSLPGVYPLRDLADALRIEEQLKKAQSAVILGGGLVGLKAAQALKQMGLRVQVVVKSGRLLSQMLDREASEIYARVLNDHGIEMVPGMDAVAFEGRGSVERVVLNDGSRIEAQLVIIGKGVEPGKELLVEAGGETGEGILVDRFLQTSIENVYAAGDVVEARDRIREERRINAIWPCAVEQGILAAANMSGRRAAYSGSMSMNAMEFFQVPVISQGIVSASASQYRQESRFHPERNVYKKVVTRDDRIVGMVFVNAIDNAGVVGELIRENVDISSVRDMILEDDFSFAHIVSLVRDRQERFPGFQPRFPRENVV